jgi:hypothetical protein
LRYFPDERDWVHLDRKWICDMLYTLDTENFQSMIDQAQMNRLVKVEEHQHLGVSMRPEFAQALQHCFNFSSIIIAT